MKSVKALTEEREVLAFEARGIFEAADKAGREMTDEEDARFKEITDDKNGLIAVKNKEIAQAEEREKAILAISAREAKKSAVERLEEITNPAARPARTLPTNGVLPENEDRGPGRVYHRVGKLKAFKTEREAYAAGMWFRAVVAREWNRPEDKEATLYCNRNGLEITNASHTGSGTAGGYLVPAPISQTIIDVRERTGIARQLATIVPLTSDTMHIPKRAGGLTVYYGAENPSSDFSDSDKTWDALELIARKRYVVSKISQELSEDALISIVDNIVAEMAYALALQEDNEFVNGDGTSTYGLVRGLKNLLGSAGTLTADTGDSTWDTLDIDDFTGAMGKLPDRFNREGELAWVCSSNFYYTAMLNVQAAAAGNQIQSLQTGDGGRRLFLGYPVFTTSQMPTSTAVSQVCALFGNFRQAAFIGDRTGVRVQRDDSIGFLRDMITLKATVRYDIRVHEGGDSSNAGAYVGLKTAAS